MNGADWLWWIFLPPWMNPLTIVVYACVVGPLFGSVIWILQKVVGRPFFEDWLDGVKRPPKPLSPRQQRRVDARRQREAIREQARRRARARQLKAYYREHYPELMGPLPDDERG